MPIMPTDTQKIRKAVTNQLSKTDAVIASNEAIAELTSETNSILEAGLSDIANNITAGFSGLASGLQELCFAVDDGFREVNYKLDLQNETLKAIKDILERPLDTQAKELRKRGEYAYLNSWIDEAENDLLESEKKNYQDFIALHILGNIYYHYKKNNQKALEYYQKAAKYAAPQSKADACKALLCAAKVYKEIGSVEDAYKSTKLAIDTLSDDTHNLFNHAAYAAMTRHPDEAIGYLKNAVLKDPTFLIAADSDERFFNVKQEKDNLVRGLRDEKRKIVVNILQRVKATLEEANTLETHAFQFLDNRISEINNLLVEVNVLCVRNSYFDLLKAENVALTTEQMARKIYDECKQRLVFSDLVVLDKETKLMWTRDAGVSGGSIRTMDDALKFIDQLNEHKYAGYCDWRLPSKEELLTLIDYGKKQGYNSSKFDELFNKEGFKNVHKEFYWSSTTRGFFRKSTSIVEIGYYRWHDDCDKGISSGSTGDAWAVRGRQ